MKKALMTKLRYSVIRIPLLGAILLKLYRAKIAFGYCSGSLLRILIWLFDSKETTNLTYHLEETNKRYLASLIAHITHKDFAADTGLRRRSNER